MGWIVPLKFKPLANAPGLPPVTEIRIFVTELGDQEAVYFTASIPADTKEFAFPAGPGTPIPFGSHNLILQGVASDGSVSNYYTCILDVGMPVPETPELSELPHTENPPYVPPTPPPTT